MAPKNAVGMLYDTTRCIGCQSCVVACAEANNLLPEAMKLGDGVHLTASDLNSFTKNIIKLYKPVDGKEYSFVKQQCMQCVDPTCVAGCMFKGLQKDKNTGVITWNSKGLCRLPLLRNFLPVPHSANFNGKVSTRRS